MHFSGIYKCLQDEDRLRMVNLLWEGPLCVCHLMAILGMDQVKASKQLRYMKELGIVEGERHAQWMIYGLVGVKDPLLGANLECLRDSPELGEQLEEDGQKRRLLMEEVEQSAEIADSLKEVCCQR